MYRRKNENGRCRDFDRAVACNASYRPFQRSECGGEGAEICEAALEAIEFGSGMLLSHRSTNFHWQ